jgi:hypothetical protein
VEPHSPSPLSSPRERTCFWERETSGLWREGQEQEELLSPYEASRTNQLRHTNSSPPPCRSGLSSRPPQLPPPPSDGAQSEQGPITLPSPGGESAPRVLLPKVGAAGEGGMMERGTSIPKAHLPTSPSFFFLLARTLSPCTSDSD